jgi:hexulose-6-phosphate isomerase
LDEINKLSDEYGLPVPSISTSLFGLTLGSDDRAARESGKDIIRRQLEYASALGADGILVVPGGMTEGITLMRAYENSFKALEELKPEIEAARINVGLENVWNTFFLSPFDMVSFIDRLHSEYIGAYFDVGNVAAFSYPEYWIEILGKRIKKIHVKDFKRAGNVNSGGAFVNLLEGSVNWSKVITALRTAGYDGYLTAELGITQECPEYLYHITSKALDIIINLK